ncbi:MAG TPA: heme-binding protein [Pirellulales bacterium]|nr:heme-binding protein [Pirellulales bacterium]
MTNPLTSWLAKLSRLGRSVPRRGAGSRRRNARRIEPLEERRLLIAGGAQTPGSTEMQFVDDLFTKVLGRSGDVSFFLNEVDNGVPFSTVIDQILTSPEYHADQIAADYSTYLHRPPDAGGAAFWQSALDGGLPETNLAASLLGSAEYFALHGGTPSGFVAGVYLDVLGRPASAADIAFWDGRLGGGETPSGVATDILNSPEHRATVIDGFYHDYLGRAVDAGGLAYWESSLAGGGTVPQLQEALLLARLGPEDYNYYPEVGGLSSADVRHLLERAAAASATQDAIIAVVDRNGNILGVRTEANVNAAYAGRANDLVFAIDGAVSLARTGAFFSSNQGALTSRTIRDLSQSTIIKQVVDSNPDVAANSATYGPGFVAPVGLGGHFPPDINNTPPVDLFNIEQSNRDSLSPRFNINPAFVPAGQQIPTPESYGVVSGLDPTAQSRGIATLPGGVPLYKFVNGQPELVGGIGVFFPGPNGYASYEQNYIAGIGQTDQNRLNAPLALEAEWMAFAAAAGDVTGTIGGVAPVTAYGIFLNEQINLVGIQLEVFGPNPQVGQPGGIAQLLAVGVADGAGRGNPMDGTDQPIAATDPGRLYAPNQLAPSGWLVVPHDSPGGQLTAADVTRIITQGIAEANLVRAAIREQPDGSGGLSPGPRTKMIFSVTDKAGNVLGLYRMPDATTFSLDVAVAKARNVAYFSDPTLLQTIDQTDPLTNTVVLPAGAAYTNRTFRFLAEPRYPSGVEGSPPGPFSILWDLIAHGFNPANLANPSTQNDLQTPNPIPPSEFTSVSGYDAFHPGTNFRDPNNPKNQNGVIFFPGSVPLYKNGVLVGGFGVSGDGVDQDDVVTAFGAVGFDVPAGTPRADNLFVRGVRLPYQKFLRNPQG